MMDNLPEMVLSSYLSSDERRKLYESHPEFDASTLEERLARVSDADVKNAFLNMLRDFIEMNLIAYDSFKLKTEAFKSFTIEFFNKTLELSEQEMKKAQNEFIKRIRSL